MSLQRRNVAATVMQASQKHAYIILNPLNPIFVL